MIFVAERKVPAVMILFGNPNRTELVSGVVTYAEELWSIPLFGTEGERNTVKSY